MTIFPLPPHAPCLRAIADGTAVVSRGTAHCLDGIKLFVIHCFFIHITLRISLLPLFASMVQNSNGGVTLANKYPSSTPTSVCASSRIPYSEGAVAPGNERYKWHLSWTVLKFGRRLRSRIEVSRHLAHGVMLVLFCVILL